MLFLPLDPHQGYLLQVTAQAIVPTPLGPQSLSWVVPPAEKHGLISKTMTKTLSVLGPLSHQLISLVSFTQRPSKESSLYVAFSSSPMPLLFILKIFQPRSLQILLCSAFPFLIFWTPITCVLDLSTISPRALQLSCLFQT